MREFSTGATRDDDTEKLDYEGFLSPLVLRRYAEYMHKHRFQADGKMRAADNWQKGIPPEAYMKSLWRHFMDAWMIWRTSVAKGPIWEEVLCAILFNVQGLLFATMDVPDDVELKVFTLGTLCEFDGMGRSKCMENSLFGFDEMGYYKPKTDHPMGGGGMDANLRRI
jgi:hypothetical protein